MLKQQLQIKLTQKLSPQQIQLMKLIQLSTLDLEQRVQSELGENPALENSANEDRGIENEVEADYDEHTRIEGEDIDVDQYLSDDEIPSYRLYANNYSSDEEENVRPISGGISFHQFLQQIKKRSTKLTRTQNRPVFCNDSLVTVKQTGIFGSF